MAYILLVVVSMNGFVFEITEPHSTLDSCEARKQELLNDDEFKESLRFVESIECVAQ